MLHAYQKPLSGKTVGIVADKWSMVAMYVAWTVNGIYGWVNWSKLNKISTKKNDCVTEIA